MPFGDAVGDLDQGHAGTVCGIGRGGGVMPRDDRDIALG